MLVLCSRIETAVTSKWQKISEILKEFFGFSFPLQAHAYDAEIAKIVSNHDALVCVFHLK